jgi:3-oxoacyl-[acyl-carrier-protein] synthase-1
MGIVSCLGNTLDDVAQSLYDAKPGIVYSEKYEEIGMKSRICGRPDIDCDEFIDRKQSRFMGLNAKFAYIAMKQARAPTALPCCTPSLGPAS